MTAHVDSPSGADLAFVEDARTATALACATGGAWHPAAPSALFSRIGSDSRAVTPGELFVALEGEAFDGHTFLSEAKQSGAAGALVRRGHPALASASLSLLVVEDTLKAYGDIAHHLRQTRTGPVIGITGSNGKTTTKELVAAVLETQGPVHKTFGNYNNLVGVPKTLLAWPEKSWAAVIEMGMNAPGEIRRLTEIAEPTLGLITCIAPAHLLGLKTVAGVARAKLELAETLLSGRPLLLNSDDLLLMKEAEKFKSAARPYLTFGSQASADVRLMRAEPQGDAEQEVTLRIGKEGKNLTFVLPLLGRHNAQNAAGAAAVGFALGLSPEQIVSGLALSRVPGGRLRVVPAPRFKALVLDDTYNANPGSMSAALETLVAQARRRPGRRSVAVLGDMLELGVTAPERHRALGAQVHAHDISVLVAFGEHAEDVVLGAQTTGGSGTVARDYASLESVVTKLLLPGDLILIKGSRGARLERLVAHLTKL